MGKVSGSRPDGVQEKKRKRKCIRSLGNKKTKRERKKEKINTLGAWVIRRKREKNEARGKENQQKDSVC